MTDNINPRFLNRSVVGRSLTLTDIVPVSLGSVVVILIQSRSVLYEAIILALENLLENA